MRIILAFDDAKNAKSIDGPGLSNPNLNLNEKVVTDELKASKVQLEQV